MVDMELLRPYLKEIARVFSKMTEDCPELFLKDKKEIVEIIVDEIKKGGD